MICEKCMHLKVCKHVETNSAYKSAVLTRGACGHFRNEQQENATLEKLGLATAKKPRWIYDDEPLCPCCGEVLDTTEVHCDVCDQRLDWSE